EGFGGKEPYYPMLVALAQLARDAQDDFVQPLARMAPSWLVQFSSLVRPAQRAALQREVLGTTRERVVRELCGGLEAFTQRNPRGITLEALHGVDRATVDLLPALARRRDAAKLLLIGTYRPAETLAQGNPLRALIQDLLVKGLCDEIAVEPLAPSQ